MGVISRTDIVLPGRPDGRPGLSAHGFGRDRPSWRAVAPASEAEHRAVLFDHVGAGRSATSAFDPA